MLRVKMIDNAEYYSDDGEYDSNYGEYEPDNSIDDEDD